MYWRYLSYWLIGVAFDNSQIPLCSSKKVLSELDLEFKCWISTVIKSKTFVNLCDTILFGSRKARKACLPDSKGGRDEHAKLAKKKFNKLKCIDYTLATDWSK